MQKICVVMRQHVRHSPTYLPTQNATHTHTKYYAAALPHTIFCILNFKNFKFSDFNKEHMSSLKMI